MLRKMRVDGPAHRLDDLVRAARRVGLELYDYAIDLSAEFGWPGRGDGHAYVLAVVDDDWQSVSDLVIALRTAHEATADDAADWITPGVRSSTCPTRWNPSGTTRPFRSQRRCTPPNETQMRPASRRSERNSSAGSAVPLADRRFAAFTTFVAGPIRRGRPDPRGGQ